MRFGKILTSVCLLSIILTVGAKDKKGVIMTVDGEDVPTQEFLYLYNKNNQQQAQPQTLEEYLPLFEVYRLKVAEAKKEGIDTTTSFRNEIGQYRRELLDPYIADTVFINQLVDIAADREKTFVESSHIMIIRTHDPDKDSRNLEILDSLRNELLKGEDFIEIAKKYSQDRFSSEKGGYLGFSPAGTFPYGFETAVYETPEGEISEIVESHVGWHIVKSGVRKPASEYNYPSKSYEDVKADVLRKSASPFDSRYHAIRQNQLQRLKNKHPELSDKLSGMNDDEALETLLIAEESEQYNTNPEYQNLVDEYTNGSLLYEVSVVNVWDKAANDTEGLEKFYERNRQNYSWESPHAKGVLIQALNDSVANIIKLNVANVPSDSIVNYVRTNFRKEATADRFNVAKGVNPMIDNLMFDGEVTNPSVKNFTVYFALDGRIVPEPEELNDVRGAVVADYQEQLEEEWVNQLKEKHSIEVNNKELSRLKKQMKDIN